VVAAAFLLIAVLSERLSDRQIAEVSGLSHQLVNKARNNFHERCKFRWGLKGIYLSLHGK
jgi:transposase-like protein